MHICFLSLSLSLPLSLSLWWSNVPCVSLCSAVWSEWRVNTRERERERLCVWLVFQRLEEHAVPFWMGILKAQSYSCCLCVSSPWPHVYKPRPQSQLFNKPKIQCISIIISNSQSCVMSGVVFFGGGGGALSQACDAQLGSELGWVHLGRATFRLKWDSNIETGEKKVVYCLELYFNLFLFVWRYV